MSEEKGMLEKNECPVKNESNAQIQGIISRHAQEIQAAMVIAKKFPRDENEAYARIMRACQRISLAEQSTYQYPKGGTKVTGPSIRLAEVLAQNWGNIDFGLIELERNNGESKMMAYAWDLETNTRQTKIFTVPHEYKSGTSIKKLTDARDIYEITANQGARRLRSCILGVIPGDIVDAALAQCEKTLTQGTKEPLADRIRKALVAFAEIGVSQDMIEKKLGYKADAMNEKDLLTLRNIYASIKDGMSDIDDWFERSQKTRFNNKEAIEEEKNGNGSTEEKSESEKSISELLKEINAPVSVQDIENYFIEKGNLMKGQKLEKVPFVLNFVRKNLISIANQVAVWKTSKDKEIKESKNE